MCEKMSGNWCLRAASGCFCAQQVDFYSTLFLSTLLFAQTVNLLSRFPNNTHTVIRNTEKKKQVSLTWKRRYTAFFGWRWLKPFVNNNSTQAYTIWYYKNTWMKLHKLETALVMNAKHKYTPSTMLRKL